MVRLCITAEGRTEQLFAVELLLPHLARHRVYLAKPRLASLGKKKGLTHRGGTARYLPLRNDILRWLKEDRDPGACFTTMVDLYGLPRDFPRYDEAAENRDPYRRVAVLEKAIEEDIADPRFVAYIQLHEFESLLLCDPAGFRSFFEEHERQIQALTEMCAQFASPELINDNEQTAPSKRIAMLIPAYTRAKAAAAPRIASVIGLDRMRGKCVHFGQWLTQLEKLGSALT